ncbi:hypothetical protein SMALA_2506 [Streptomyces malaysiensis subsp. malaysiensis]|nr:hypothetical protein SMALA_2506 [Streptomyces malaysiensis]
MPWTKTTLVTDPPRSSGFHRDHEPITLTGDDPV